MDRGDGVVDPIDLGSQGIAVATILDTAEVGITELRGPQRLQRLAKAKPAVPGVLVWTFA